MNKHVKELILTYSSILLCNYLFWPDDPIFISLQFHPFLFVTILFAVKYGVVMGSVSGVLSAVLIITAQLYQYDFILLELIDGPDKMMQPLVILVLGIFIGETVESRLKKTQYYQGALKKEVNSYLEKSKEAQGLQESLLNIEKRIAGHSLGVRDFTEAVMEIFNKNHKEIYPYMNEILKKFLHVQESFILISKPDIYHQKMIHSIVNENDQSEIELIRNNEVYQESLHQRKVLSITDVIEHHQDEWEEGYPIYYCGPILRQDNSIEAMVVVRKIPFIQFNITNFRLFEILLATASVAIKHIQAYESIYASSPWHDRWPVEREHYFLRNLSETLEVIDKVEIMIVGYDFSSECKEGQREGFMILLAELCLKQGVKIGYIEKANCFCVYSHEIIGDELIANVEQRYNSYGFSSSFAELKLKKLEITKAEVRREDSFFVHLVEKNFI